MQREYASRAGTLFRPLYSQSLLVESMKAFVDFYKAIKQPNSPQQNFLSRKSQKDRRAKNIIIEDSFRTFNCVTFEKSSKLLTGRAPFRKDSELIDYEMDSEEEWAE